VKWPWPGPASELSPIARKSQQWFDALIVGYGRMLNWVLDRQGPTLLVAVATLALTTYLYVIIPKGFFPVQDTGLIQGISEATQTVSYAAMAERQQALADAVLKDPDVVSLSSLIGVDGAKFAARASSTASADSAAAASASWRSTSSGSSCNPSAGTNSASNVA
jgi:multidrug efflux pump subunit AcrB